MMQKPALRAPRVLVVEDDRELRGLLRSLIESLGMPVDEADNGRDALEMLKGDTEIGIVLLDLGLPPAPQDYSEGIGFLKQVAALTRLTQVIVLTGQAQDEATLLAIEHGAADYLTKPFDWALLKQSIERAKTWAWAHGQMLSDSKVPMYIVAGPASEEAGIKSVSDFALEKLIRTVLADTGKNVTQAARRLGITREHLYYFMQRFGIKRKDD